MWVIFIATALTFGVAALAICRIAVHIITASKRQMKKFEIEEEAYEKAKKIIREGKDNE